MGAYYDPLSGNFTPADLQKTNAAAAATAASTSKDSYTKTISLRLVKGKTYEFYFKYKYEDPQTKEIKLSDSSPVWRETFAIPNLTKSVKNLTLTAGSQSYGVKFDLDPLSVQEDVVIFESLTSDFATQTIVYTGTSTNVSILTTGTTAFSPRWVKVRSRDRWDDLNISEATAGPVTPFSADVDTTYTVANPTSTSSSAAIDPKDLSGFSLVSTISWAQSADIKTAGYAIRWSTDNPSTVTTPLWEYASVSGRSTTSFTATGLIPNTTYYYQVASTTPYDVVNWTDAASGTFIASDADGTAAGALARLKSYIAIGGATQDLFKIGTGISQSINLNTDPIVSPTLTAGTYHGIVLNKSTTNVGNNFWLTTGQFRVGNPTEFMYWNGTNLYLTGNINATGGKFTGNVQLAIPTGGTTSGTLYAGASSTSGARVRLSSEGIFAYDSTSTNNTTGKTFSLEQATGRLDAIKGTVGGWTMDTAGFSSTNTKIENNGTITLGDTTGTLGSIVRMSATDPNYRLWVGSQTGSNAKFKVGTDGTLYATGAVIGLGAGSSIEGYATTSALNNYTLTSVTSGINGRLTTAEGTIAGQAGTISTLSSSVATKNTTFVTTDSTQPYANKAGDLWINGGDNNSIWTANSAGYNWTEKSNGKYATTTQLGTKLSAGGYAIAATDGQITNITSNGIYITSGNFKIANTNESAPSSGGYMLINSAGITAYNGTETTFAINSSGGNAAFKGNISGSTGTFSGTLVAGQDNDATGYINTGSSRTVGTYGTVQYVKIRALGLESTSNSGFVSSVYPWLDNSASLGTNSYSWNAIYIGTNAYFANGTTYKIGSTGDAYLNGYGISGGYGVTSDWSPRSDNTYSLGLSTRRWVDVWAVDTSVNSSDIRLKKDIATSSLGLNFIKLLRPVSYKWKQTGVQEVLEDKEIEHLDKQGNVELVEIEKVPKVTGIDENGRDIIETTSREGLRDHYGFIAQEVKEALDSTGVGDSFAGWVLDDHNNPDSRQNLRYSEFISPLVKAVQELSDMVESLQQEINILKGI
jgi:hypothetical protein